MSKVYMINRERRLHDIGIPVSDDKVEELNTLLSTFVSPKDRSLTTGKVTRATTNEVWVDIGAKAEGVLPAEEFNLRGFGEKINVGDTVEVWLQEAWSATAPGAANAKQEYSNISFAKAAQIRAWKNLEQSYKNRKLVDGIILSKTPGGYVISILPYGARGFLPLSHADPQIGRSNEILQKYKTQIHQFLIIRMERSWNIIVSRREAMFAESPQEEQQVKNGNGNGKGDEEQTPHRVNKYPPRGGNRR